MNASFFSRIASETTALGSDLSQLVAARLDLLKLEIDESLRQMRQFAVVLAIFGAVTLVGIALLAWAMVALTAHQFAVRPEAMAAVVGLMLTIGGAATIWTAKRRFCHDFTGLNDSLAELREDLHWLREWRPDSAGGDRASSDLG